MFNAVYIRQVFAKRIVEADEGEGPKLEAKTPNLTVNHNILSKASLVKNYEKWSS